MKIHLHIGLDHCGAQRLQDVLAEKRSQLEGKGVLFPRTPGAKNHTRLFMAVTAPDAVDPLRFNRGFITEEKQTALRDQIAEGLARDVEAAKPEVLILSASQLGTSLTSRAELETLRDLLTPLSKDITVTAHVDEPARLLARAYAAQVMEGRARGLDLETGLVDAPDWWEACLALAPDPAAERGQFPNIQTPAFWLDYQRLVRHWEATFGAGSVRLRSYDPDRFTGPDVVDELAACFDITEQFGKADPWTPPAEPSAAWVARSRQMNDLLLRLLSEGKHVLTRTYWKRFMDEIAIDGPPIAPGTLGVISDRFAGDREGLCAAHPGLDPARMEPDAPEGPWLEAGTRNGYRASQYLLGWMWRVERSTADHAKAKLADIAELNGEAPQGETRAKIKEAVTPEAMKIMSPLALEKFASLQTSSFKPHNRLGRVNEEDLAAPFEPAYPTAPAPVRPLPAGSTGRVIVGCMKNEAPYILEWIAYHRAVGFDTFLIYTNDCTDGTDKILARLDELGIVHHRNNDKWEGNSPQQYALDNALEEEVIRNAEWIAHIDVDEFVNIRCGNGTLDDFFERVPAATNVSMTWRLFGHNGVTALEDRPVIEQFTACAPKYCPKPHTVWGFKTMFRNIGAYEKLSCHRPNKLVDDKIDQVAWVNGSGLPTTKEQIKNGWRSSKKSIGYDLIQLNHYALRSAESYLVKRQRGRALHVDRSIGLNYWIRMDWSNYTDVTITRNLPRLRAEMDALMADDTLRGLHEAGFAWHKAKAEELHGIPEFQELYEQALEIKLTETERVAIALALDLES